MYNCTTLFLMREPWGGRGDETPPKKAVNESEGPCLSCMGETETRDLVTPAQGN